MSSNRIDLTYLLLLGVLFAISLCTTLFNTGLVLILAGLCTLVFGYSFYAELRFVLQQIRERLYG